MNPWPIHEPKLLGSANPTTEDLLKDWQNGFRRIICLLDDEGKFEDPESPGYDVPKMQEKGFTRYCIPVRNNHPPSPPQYDLFLEKLRIALSEGRVLVHCDGGLGRTGSMAAAYWISKGLPAGEAMRKVRDSRPGAIETVKQEESLRALATRMSTTPESYAGLRLVEVYGSLLNSAERRTLVEAGHFREVGKEMREGWMLSFDKKSVGRHEGVLNLVETNRKEDVFYTTVFGADGPAYDKLLDREMGPSSAELLRKGRPVASSSYRPIPVMSSFGLAELFVIPKEGRKRTRTRWDAKYVQIVKRGIEESYTGKQRETNLRALRAAVSRSQGP